MKKTIFGFMFVMMAAMAITSCGNAGSAEAADTLATDTVADTVLVDTFAVDTTSYTVAEV